MTAIASFDSAKIDGYFTRVTLAATGALSKLELYQDKSPPVLAFSLPISAAALSAVSVTFAKIDLAMPANNQSPLAVVRYELPGAGTPVVTPSLHAIAIKFPGVPAIASNTNVAFSPIDVTLILSRPTDDAGIGWIDLDVHFTYPAQLDAGGGAYAWETRVRLPRLRLASSARAYSLLHPEGLVGTIPAFASSAPYRAMGVQATALYHLQSRAAPVAGSLIHSAEGVAIFATDTRGHQKSLACGVIPGSGNPPPPADPTLEIEHVAPIHLLQNSYVRPADGDGFTLSGGDAQGFGGSGMKLRLRAFHVEAPVPDALVDWFDVADLYRSWARASSMFARPSRTAASAPADAMSPYTIIANYSLEGPVTVADGGLALASALDVHPIVVPAAPPYTIGPDAEGNTNETLPALLARVQGVFQAGTVLEAQIWGFEMGGYYRFLGGFPPLTDVLSGQKKKLRTALDNLFARGIVPSITTSPLSTFFDRLRYAGHLLPDGQGGWKAAVAAPFPAAVTAQLLLDVVTANGDGSRGFLLQPSIYTDARVLGGDPGASPRTWGEVKLRLDGTRWVDGPTERFGQETAMHICPTPSTRGVYLTWWLTGLDRGVFDTGARVLEFMRHHYSDHLCYDRSHDHCDPPLGSAYDNAIGRGPWYAGRVAEMLSGARALAHDMNVYPSFTITNEHPPVEALVPQLDEFYDDANSSISVLMGDTRSLSLLTPAGAPAVTRTIPLFRFVYSEIIAEKMTMLNNDNLIHPGYRDVLKAPAGPVTLQSYFLSPARDSDAAPGPTPGDWGTHATAYCNARFDATKTVHGLAPSYAAGNGPHYTYSRALQDVFTLRARILRLCAAAVRGERILLSAEWLTGPDDYNAEAIAVARRAAHLQGHFKGYFRSGWMLGQAPILSGNATAYAYWVDRRDFGDIAVLEGPLGYDPAQGDTIFDAISRDPAQAGRVKSVQTDRIQHMVWQTRIGRSVRTLYVFANGGNDTHAVVFRYTRGLLARVGYQRQQYLFVDDPNGTPTLSKPVRLGDQDTMTLPARCLGVVVVS
jgi:hypothetical protein